VEEKCGDIGFLVGLVAVHKLAKARLQQQQCGKQAGQLLGCLSNGAAAVMVWLLLPQQFIASHVRHVRQAAMAAVSIPAAQPCSMQQLASGNGWAAVQQQSSASCASLARLLLASYSACQLACG
jgi:hypothetical protein